MTLRHLHIFVTVFQAGGITRAAHILHVAQPSISLAVHELEEHYGVRLFERTGRKIVPTECGRSFYGYALHIVSLFRDMEHHMADWNSAGTLRIGASITVGTHVLPALLDRCKQRFPDIRAEVVINNSATIERFAVDNAIDVGLIENNPEHPDIHSTPFRKDRLCGIAPPGHPLAGRSGVTLPELARFPLLLREKGSGSRESSTPASPSISSPSVPSGKASATRPSSAASPQASASPCSPNCSSPPAYTPAASAPSPSSQPSNETSSSSDTKANTSPRPSRHSLNSVSTEKIRKGIRKEPRGAAPNPGKAERKERHAGEIIPPAPPCFRLRLRPRRAGVRLQDKSRTPDARQKGAQGLGVLGRRCSDCGRSAGVRCCAHLRWPTPVRPAPDSRIKGKDFQMFFGKEETAKADNADRKMSSQRSGARDLSSDGRADGHKQAHFRH